LAMRNSWLIAMREFRERIGARSFVLMSFLGPLLILLIMYILFAFGGEGKQRWNVLIADPSGIMENKILANKDKSVTYSFADGYLEIEEFRDGNRFQEFDALVEINEKVLSNKTVYVFFREKPSVRMQTRVQFQVERRLEESMIEQFTKLSLADFRKIKQPMNVAFRNAYDPLDESSDKRGWVGFFFGAMIFVFIFLFGMTILRSISIEKSNRIVEVLLASVHPRQLMLGKIAGIGLAAFIQFFVWTIVIAAGLFVMREFLFIDNLDASKFDMVQLTKEVQEQTSLDKMFAAKEYNEFVDLVYERVQFGTMITYFLLFFVAGYFFYGAFFAAIGATSGSESDGQQFVLPLIFLLVLSLYSGYYTLENPDASIVLWLQYIPFTAPVVVMVKLAYGYGPGEIYHLYLSLIFLAICAVFMLMIAGRLYKNGILQFGHRIRFLTLLKWLKKS
jgi:ABC-2 type transport system permease protein